MKHEKDAYEGMWDFDGGCAPPENGGSSRSRLGGMHETFTLGCFQWVRRGKHGKGIGLKKGKVQHRIKGSTNAPAAAYQKAREYCDSKNAAISDASLKSPQGDDPTAEDSASA